MRKTSIISIPPMSGRVTSNFWKYFFILTIAFNLFTISGNTQNNAIADPSAAYLQTITQRSNKIVAVLGINDSAKFYRVQAVLVNQYQNLNATHDAINAKIKIIKTDSTIEKAARADKIRLLEEERMSATASLHQSFIKNLLLI